MASRTWNRWHTDGWVLTVVRSDDNQFTYSAAHHAEVLADHLSARNLADAQHRAEDLVRNSGHRCTGPCSFWVADTPEED